MKAPNPYLRSPRVTSTERTWLNAGALLDYHSRYKLVFLAHSQRNTANLARSWLIFTSGKIWMLLQPVPPTRSCFAFSPRQPTDHTNVLMHVQGYFRPHIDSKNASSWLRLSTVIAVASNHFCAADAYQTLYGALS